MIGRLAIIRVGLIGGSLLLALKHAGVVGDVTGYGRNRRNPEKGVEIGVLDEFGATMAETVRGAEVVVVAVPLDAMRRVLAKLKQCTASNAAICADDADELPGLFGRAKSERDSLVGSF